MESVFVTENPIDIHFFVNECNEVQKLKIGEIFQLKNGTLSMCCTHCLQEFYYFTEFSLHIQEHYLRGEVAQLKEIKEDDTKNCFEEKPSQNYEIIACNAKSEMIGDVETDLFQPDFELADGTGWSDGELNTGHPIFEPEINVQQLERLTEKALFIEGTDYEKINDKFQCLICNYGATRWEHCQDHLRMHSNAPNIFCPICSKSFNAVSYVRKHVNRTHKMKITADKIREAQPSFSASAEVLHSKQTGENKSFIEGEDYLKANGRFKCLTCGREMLDHIKEHLLTHSNAKDVYCPMCDKKFIAVSYVRKHVNRAHKMRITAEEIKAAQTTIDIPSRKDTFCHNSVQNNTLSAVICTDKIENTQKNFECFDCHRQFTSLSSLRIHLKLHSGIKYACPHCDKKFAMRSYVRDHIVAMHGIKRDEIPKDSIHQASGNLLSEPRPNVEWFECSFCNNRYGKRQTLRQHMKTHTSGPFLCVICGAVYKSIANLRYHMERHQADPNKRHKCMECGKTYPTRRYMLSHYRTIHLNKRRRRPKTNKPSNNNEEQLINI